MIIMPHLRQGIGFDIEFNDDICHIVETDDGDVLFAFSGVIICLPFIKLYIGDLVPVCDLKEGDK